MTDPAVAVAVRARSAQQFGRPVEEIDTELERSVRTTGEPAGVTSGRTRRHPTSDDLAKGS